MKHKSLINSLGLAAILMAGLSACTVVPAYPPGHYRAPPPAYVETYPAYGYSGSVYYAPPRQHYREHHHERRYDDRHRHDMPLPPPLQLHRDIRRSLGLPRLPGMP